MTNNNKINYIMFFVLSFLIIVGYSVLFPPSQEKADQNSNSKDQIVRQEAKSDNSPVNTPVKNASVNNDISKQSNDIINVKSNIYEGKVDTYGGRIVEWILSDYNQTTDPDSGKYSLLHNLPPNFNMSVLSHTVDIPDPIPFKYTGGRDVIVKDTPEEIKLSWISPEGIEIEKTLTFGPNSYLVNVDFSITNRSQNPFRESTSVDIFSILLKKATSSRSLNNEFIAFVSNDIQKGTKIPEEAEKYTGNISWFGFLDKYFLYTFLPESSAENYVTLTAVNENGLVNALYYYPENEIKPSNSQEYKSKIYLGPLDYKILSNASPDLHYAIDYGKIEFLAKPVLNLLNYLNQIFNNYGLSIIVITILIRIVFLPLTIKSMSSMKRVQIKMQELKPKIDALKEKYKDDKSTQNTEMMKLYTSHGVNPLSSLGGCLPMLIQIPVFFALYEVLLYSIDLRHSHFLWINDLSAPEHLFDIPGIGIPFRILPLAMGVSWFISQKMTPSTTPGSEQMELQMKMMQFMPIIFTVMFWGLPSGLILYWTVSNILSIGQQLYVNKRTNPQ